MKKEILILVIIIGAFALIQSLNFVKMPETKGSPLLIPTDEVNFYQNVERSGDWVMLEFHAPWCGFCKKLKPVINELAQAHKDHLKILPINKDESPSLANEFHVSGIPALILLYKGREVDRRIGYMPKAVLSSWVEGVMQNDPSTSP
ncbi:thioredoxin family protein [Kiritimatiellaeota bacterium B1221]|nr:thioredoxin family protein [Kiritimatiellaeota bacterium B1221]